MTDFVKPSRPEVYIVRPRGALAYVKITPKYDVIFPHNNRYFFNCPYTKRLSFGRVFIGWEVRLTRLSVFLPRRSDATLVYFALYSAQTVSSGGLGQCEEANLHLVLLQQTSWLSMRHRSRSIAQQYSFAADGFRSRGNMHASRIC